MRALCRKVTNVTNVTYGTNGDMLKTTMHKNAKVCNYAIV